MLHTLVWEWNCFLGEVQDEGGQQLEGESRGLRRGRRGVSMGTNSCNSRQWSRKTQCGFEEGGEKRRDSPPIFLWTVTTFNLTDSFVSPYSDGPFQLFASESVTAPCTENLLWHQKEVNFICSTKNSRRNSTGGENSLNTKDSYSFETLRKFQRAFQRAGCQLS